MAALRAREAIKALHFAQPGKQAFAVSVLQQAAEFLDSGGTAHEDLHTAGIANQVRFVLLCDPHLPYLRTYGTRKHRLTVDSYHRNSSSAITFAVPQKVRVPVSHYKAVFPAHLESPRREQRTFIVTLR